MGNAHNYIGLFGHIKDPLEILSLADPGLAAKISDRMEKKNHPVKKAVVRHLVTDILSALSQEVSFGQALANGVADLLGAVEDEKLLQFCRLACRAGGKGPTLGRLLAVYLVPVFKFKEGKYIDRVLEAIDIMLQKGTYTLKDPLETLSHLLATRDEASAVQYLGLLCDTFSLDITYNRCQHFTREIPRAVRKMRKTKRPYQTFQMRRVVKADVYLTTPFLEGLDRGLDLLSQQAVETFVSRALAEFQRDKDLGIKFLSLASMAGVDALSELQVTVSLSQIRNRLNRYLQARLDRPLSVRPMGSLPPAFSGKADHARPLAFVDSRFVYLPDEIDRFDTRQENLGLYRILTKLEAGCIEFGTYGFDLEKAGAEHPQIRDAASQPASADYSERRGGSSGNPDSESDLVRFFNFFPNGDLAAALFTLFEHGRLRVLMERYYPGLARETMPILRSEAIRQGTGAGDREILTPFYHRIALGCIQSGTTHSSGEETLEKVSLWFEKEMASFPGPAASALLTLRIYFDISRLLADEPETGLFTGTPDFMRTPFNRWIRPDLVNMSLRSYLPAAERIQQRLDAMGFKIYKTDIIWELSKSGGDLTEEDVRKLIVRSREKERAGITKSPHEGRNLQKIDLSGILVQELTGGDADACGDARCFRYREWDYRLCDYLPNHVRVSDRQLKGGGIGFYRETVKKHEGLVKKIRYGFELIKPEGYRLLRCWIEGDEFDYRALLDYAIDRKMGRTPSERLYNKRVKHHRDVAVLLLMDVSRSTANRVPGGVASVLDVEKEAVVLLCEALSVVGDTFAVAGFSGTGRLGVDYYRVKEFFEPFGEKVKDRLDALSPQRNTRMGAAIRHATAQLEEIPSKVRLLLILGDGFPNDTDYKKVYAAEDTRKAILEARSANLHTHAITVNLAEANLDHLYGRSRHSIISNVRELPDKLPGIYGALTKS